MAAEETKDKTDDKKKKKAGRKAAGAAVAFTAAVGVFFSSLFGTPNDLLADPGVTDPPAIVMEISTDDEAEEEQEARDENEEKPGFFARIRAYILRLPLFVRVAVGIPLWALGWLVTQAFSALWKLFLAPVAERILTFLIMAAILMIVAAIVLKLIFPDLSLQEILSRPNILIVLIGITLCCVLNFVLDRALPGFSDREGLVRFLEGLVILIVLVIRMAFVKRRKLNAQPAA